MGPFFGLSISNCQIRITVLNYTVLQGHEKKERQEKLSIMMRAASEAKIASSLSGSNKEFRGFDRTNTATVMETSRSGTESPIQQTSGKIN